MAVKGQPKTPGSGRQKGSARQTARASADVVHAWRDAGKPMPLDVMLAAMMEELEDPENIKNKRQNRRAFPYANAAAVYCHAKPQNQTGTLEPETAARLIMEAVRAMDERTRKPEAPPAK